MLEGFRVYKMQRKYLLWKNFDLAFDTILFDQEELLNLNLKVYLKQLSLLCQWQAWPIRITEMVQEFTKSLKLTRMTMMMAAQEMRIPFCRRVLCKFLSSPNSPETSFCWQGWFKVVSSAAIGSVYIEGLVKVMRAETGSAWQPKKLRESASLFCPLPWTLQLLAAI